METDAAAPSAASRAGGPRARGHTLLELAAGLLLLAVVLAASLPAFGSTLDRLAVWQARERAAGLLARARAEAPTRGGARVVISESPPEMRLETGDTVTARLGASDLEGATLELSGSRSTAVLTWDALGVGRVASRTLLFRRGDARARLVIGAYGRIRRR